MGRDFKEVFANDPIRAKITDFGESRSKFDQTKSIFMTNTTSIVKGSPGFMAPELLPGM